MFASPIYLCYTGDVDAMTEPPTARPIGFWVKLVDRLLDERLAQTLAPHQLDRRRWQVLNLLDRAPRTLTDLARELDPFVHDDLDALHAAVDALVDRGLVDRSGEQLTLSDAGRSALRRAHDDVAADRRVVTRGLDLDAYTATVASLEAMARNLGWDG